MGFSLELKQRAAIYFLAIVYQQHGQPKLSLIFSVSFFFCNYINTLADVKYAQALWPKHYKMELFSSSNGQSALVVFWL